MGFPKEIINNRLFFARFMCEICGRDVSREHPDDVAVEVIHSWTSFHLVDGPITYLAFDPPRGYEILKGKRILAECFAVSRLGLKDDAVCLCRTCHAKVHRDALAETKRRFPSHKGRTSLPTILEEVTLSRIYDNQLRSK